MDKCSALVDEVELDIAWATEALCNSRDEHRHEFAYLNKSELLCIFSCLQNRCEQCACINWLCEDITFELLFSFADASRKWVESNRNRM